jgi:hypothetical protein
MYKYPQTEDTCDGRYTQARIFTEHVIMYIMHNPDVTVGCKVKGGMLWTQST